MQLRLDIICPHHLKQEVLTLPESYAVDFSGEVPCGVEPGRESHASFDQRQTEQSWRAMMQQDATQCNRIRRPACCDDVRWTPGKVPCRRTWCVGLRKWGS